MSFPHFRVVSLITTKPRKRTYICIGANTQRYLMVVTLLSKSVITGRLRYIQPNIGSKKMQKHLHPSTAPPARWTAKGERSDRAAAARKGLSGRCLAARAPAAGTPRSRTKSRECGSRGRPSRAAMPPTSSVRHTRPRQAGATARIVECGQLA